MSICTVRAANRSMTAEEEMPDFGRKAGNCKPSYNPLLV
jgi:hypothetical protein